MRRTRAILVLSLLSAALLALAACNGLIGATEAAPPGSGGTLDGDAGEVIDDTPVTDAGTVPIDRVGPPFDAQAGSADGVCHGGNVQLGRFDPDCIYALGTVDLSSPVSDVLFDPAHPWVTVAGFGTSFAFPTIRPTDGRLLFVGGSGSAAKAYLFEPGSLGEDESVQYARHEVIPTPACIDGDLRRVVLAPDTPRGVYECSHLGPRYYELGSNVRVEMGGRRLLSFGEKGTALATTVGGGPMFIVDGATVNQVTGLHAGGLMAARGKPGGGFWIAAATAASPSVPHLYEVPIDGVAVDRGEYLMGNLRITELLTLDPAGALVGSMSSRDFTDFYDVIARLRPDAAPVVIFDEEDGHAVKLQASEMVSGATGP